MHRSTRRSSRLAASAATLMALTLGAAACGSGGSSDDDSKAVSSSKPCGTDEDTTVTVGLFGTFGFKENGLYDEYMKLRPNITIKEDVVEQSADYWTRLKTRLASGSGLADVQAIEIGFVADVVQNHADQFVNFNDVPDADTLKASFYDWKWQQATTPDGKTRSGSAPTSARRRSATARDLLKQAGLPADPARAGQASGRPGTTSSTSARSTRPKTEPRPRSWTAPRASSPPPSTRATRPTTTTTASPIVENSDGVQERLELRHPGGPGRHHRRAAAVHARRGTRRSPAARSQRSPAPPG